MLVTYDTHTTRTHNFCKFCTPVPGVRVYFVPVPGIIYKITGYMYGYG